MELIRTLTGQSQKSYYGSDRPEGSSTGEMQSPTKTLTTTDPATGTLNHLSEAQVDKLIKFKERLEKDGWWSPNGVNGKPTHDDGTLLRYLRARKFDIEGAVGQFSDTEKWMKENKIEELYEHYDVEEYEKARRLYPMWTGRRDKRGIPIYVYNIKPLTSKAVDNASKDAQKYKNSLPNHKNLSTPAKMLPLFALYHNLLNFVLPLCSTLERPNPEIPVTNSTNIVDISGVGLTQFWNLKAHMQDASVLATAHYPETLDRIFIIGAPSFFPTVWGWIKRWFDPVTVSKIFILSKHEVTPTLSKFMEKKDFPQKYGGDLKWDWGDLPQPDEDALEALSKDGNQGWVSGPCLYLERMRIVVGSEKGKLRRTDEEISKMKPVVYAADYTEEPVHPDRRSSSVGSRPSMSMDRHDHEKVVNKLTPIQTAADQPTNEGEKAAIGAGAAGAAGVAGAAAVAHHESKASEKAAPQTPSHQPPAGVEQENLRKSPIDGSPLNLPNGQPAEPARTAEYISPNLKPTEPQQSVPVQEAIPAKAAQKPAEPSTNASQPAPAAQPANHAPAPAPAAVVSTSKSDSRRASTDKHEKEGKEHHHLHKPHLGGLFHHKKGSKDHSNEGTSVHAAVTNSTPASDYTQAMHQSIGNHMQGESISVVNGSAGNPDMVLTSDRSKGLAVEADKLQGVITRGDDDQVQRFVTAAERRT